RRDAADPAADSARGRPGADHLREARARCRGGRGEWQRDDEGREGRRGCCCGGGRSDQRGQRGGGVTVRVVTALRERPRGTVEIELDGSAWRVIPTDAVVRAGLSVGGVLDEQRLDRELQRAEALARAALALRH